MTLDSRALSTIAREIDDDWKNVYFGARPYLRAMRTLNSVESSFDLDSGRSVVSYFLANAQSWRGVVARRVKAELKRLLA